MVPWTNQTIGHKPYPLAQLRTVVSWAILLMHVRHFRLPPKSIYVFRLVKR